MDNAKEDHNKFKITGERLINGVIELDQAVAWKEKELRLLDIKYPGKSLPSDKHSRWQEEKQNITERFNRRWLASLDYLRHCCEKVRQTQPHLDKLKKTHVNTGGKFPSQIVFGSLALSYANFYDSIPRLVSFPLDKALWVSGGISELALVYQLLLRLLFALPVGCFEIYAADPLKGGKSLGHFLPLFTLKNLAPHCRVLTRADEIENMLRVQLDYVEDMRQRRFMDDTTTWKTYNDKNSKNLLSYRLILVFDIPEQLTDKSLWFLTRIIELGPDCGVLPVLMGEEKTADKYTDLFNSLKNSGKRITALLPENKFAGQIKHIAIEEKEEPNPPSALMEKMIAAISDAYKAAADINKDIEELWPEASFWKNSAAKGLSVPIGWDDFGEEVYFSIGGADTEHHTLIGGSSGSGKSNLMHVIIHSLCHYYPPDELRIYILDYKQGTESQVYSNPPLPHADLIALESDPEYGSAVFKALVDEKEQRARLFKDSGYDTVDYYQYRNKGKTLPRILLIVDEFQGLFGGNKTTGEKTEKYLYDLLRQGRSYGIHILLSTQALTGIQDILSSRQLTSQIGCRIVLACMPDDSMKILGNNGAANLDKGRHEAIINTSNGRTEGNLIFRSPLAGTDSCSEHSKRFVEEAKKRGYIKAPKIFNGTVLPSIPSQDSFRLPECEEAEIFPMLIGESLTYEADNFIISFHQSPASNLLIAGADPAIHDGLLLSILFNILALNRNVEPEHKVQADYFWGKIGRKAPAFINRYPDINIVTSIDNIGLEAIVENIKQGNKTRRIVIIDGLESVRNFHLETRPSEFDLKKAPALPAYLLRDILENGPPLGTVIIAFSENWNHCSQVCAALIKSFEQRIGFGLGEVDAGKLLSGAGSDKLAFRGIESGRNCAVYADRLITRQELFRPYIIKTSDGDMSL
jgi:hypothetical protein